MRPRKARLRERVFFDVLIVGGGPAGMSAALWLGRCGRRAIVLDQGEPRNAASRALHGYLTRDGVPPDKLRDLARRDVALYPSIKVLHATVQQIQRTSSGFETFTNVGDHFRSTLLLLATGRVDPLPNAPGFQRLFGRGVYHCPYCDGWEHRGEAVAVYGHTAAAGGIANLLRTWTDDVIVCTDGRRPSGAIRRASIPVVTTRIAKLAPDARRELARIDFADGTSRPCRALFFCSACAQKSDLPRKLGCAFDNEGAVICHAHAAQGVPGLFVAGNVRNGVHLAITAAAEGAEAALAMNEVLLDKSPASRPRGEFA